MGHPWFMAKATAVPVEEGEGAGFSWEQVTSPVTLLQRLWRVTGGPLTGTPLLLRLQLEARKLRPPWRPTAAQLESGGGGGSGPAAGEEGEWADTTTEPYTADSAWSAAF